MQSHFKEINFLAVVSYIPALLLAFLGLSMVGGTACGFECNATRANAEPIFFYAGAAMAAIVTLRLVWRNTTTWMLLGITLVLLPTVLWSKLDAAQLLNNGSIVYAVAIVYQISSLGLGFLLLALTFTSARKNTDAGLSREKIGDGS
ncbi:MAG: hypothetical protein A2021_07495 [Elusimicrobia bacterium GWF2_52_66]|nr:MAG: hypothetical protein A2X33_09900 [Elusimicrobia bacterium GWA2_51_34]OGR86854.1 MAG: hypothetical protein A2021_07495 [Elusimicrobia bacterium GWF2_52_66]HAF95901.1 hypothetical protein [Elusimicrobiota bacterium]HCE98011.1 hypothetical protein [Elusimicrobiota bacterium]